MVEERIITARVITLEVQSKCADDLLEEMQMDEWGDEEERVEGAVEWGG